MPEAALLDPLRRPAFRRLSLSYAVNELGDWMGIVALSVLVYDHTGSALATMVLFMGTGFLPALLAPVIVVRAEQPPPVFVLPALYAGEAAAFAGLALLAAHFSLAGVFVLAAFDGALALAARSLTRAVAAAMLGHTGELRAGNAILNIAFTGGAALGPAVAGLVVAAFGVQTALLLDAFSFYAIAWILLTAGPLAQAGIEAGTIGERLRQGIDYIRGRARLRRLLIAEGCAFVFFAAILPVEVVYAKETLDAGDAGYGLLLASWGAGMVIGGLVFAASRRASLPLMLFFSTLGVGAGYVGMALAPDLPTACVAACLGGTGNGVQWVAMVSAVQELTAEEMQARVMSVLESAGAAMPGLGFLLGGAVAAAASPRAAFMVAGLGVGAIVAVAAPLLGRDWGDDLEQEAGSGEEIVVELIPAGAGRPAEERSMSGSEPEVGR
jgi:predicted MFS family arabinose efflux permease